MATTAISDFYEPIRFLLEDRDPTIQLYSDDQLLIAVRTCIRLQRVPGYSLAVDLTQITPEVADPNKWALVVYHTVKHYVDNQPDRYSYRTRAVSESFGGWRGFLDELKTNIYKLENGAMFSSWNNLYTWFAGMAGLPLNTVMTELFVHAPFWSGSLGTDGLHNASD